VKKKELRNLSLRTAEERKVFGLIVKPFLRRSWLSGKSVGNRKRAFQMAKLVLVSPISGEDTNMLPVKDLRGAISYYESALGFTTAMQDDSTAVLRRDEVQIGLVVQKDHRSSEAGSLAFAVDNLDELHHELSKRGGIPGEFGIDEWGGKQHRTFFMREDENGYCYCFYYPVQQ
jgi:lactoylglutathione lyase